MYELDEDDAKLHNIHRQNFEVMLDEINQNLKHHKNSFGQKLLKKKVKTSDRQFWYRN